MIPPPSMPNKENIVLVGFLFRQKMSEMHGLLKWMRHKVVNFAANELKMKRCTHLWLCALWARWIVRRMHILWMNAFVFSVECRILFGCKRMNEMIFNSIRLFLRLQPFCSFNIPKRRFYWRVKRLLRYKFCIDPTKLGSTDWMS